MSKASRYAGWPFRLQSCRPLSGAVITKREIRRKMGSIASIVPPPFGSGYWGRTYILPAGACRFNRAAPFRERLYQRVNADLLQIRRLQSCRPLSGAVISLTWSISEQSTALQSCRPLSGAVMRAGRPLVHTPPAASIVPPPFGSGYGGRRRLVGDAPGASIVPPPFGSGYVRHIHMDIPGLECFNRAAPFRERLFGVAQSPANPVPPSFNRAAPFRERLSLQRVKDSIRLIIASIVPPPFGSGYAAAPG